MNLQKITTKDGKITLGSNGLKQIIRSLDDGEWMVKIEQYKEKRRLRQNNFIHLCFDVYGDEIGLSPDEAKDYLKKKYGINTVYKDPEGKQRVKVRDTSSYNIEECATFIDRILKHFEYDCNIIIDPKVRKQYKIDELTGEMEEI